MSAHDTDCTTRPFTFGELWALAMQDEDFAAGRIDAEEVFRRLRAAELEER